MKRQKSGGELKVLTWPQIEAAAELEEDRIRAHRRWGKWQLSVDTLELIYEVYPGRFGYGVDLERMRTSAAMLDWVCQVAKKKWASPKDVGDLIRALNDIFDPQARLCSLACIDGRGIGKTLDATAFLRNRYRTNS